MQIQVGEGSTYRWRERILTVLVVVVTSTRAVPERMEQAIVMRFGGLRAERRVLVWRSASWPRLK